MGGRKWRAAENGGECDPPSHARPKRCLPMERDLFSPKPVSFYQTNIFPAASASHARRQPPKTAL